MLLIYLGHSQHHHEQSLHPRLLSNSYSPKGRLHLCEVHLNASLPPPPHFFLMSSQVLPTFFLFQRKYLVSIEIRTQLQRAGFSPFIFALPFVDPVLVSYITFVAEMKKYRVGLSSGSKVPVQGNSRISETFYMPTYVICNNSRD